MQSPLPPPGRFRGAVAVGLVATALLAAGTTPALASGPAARVTATAGVAAPSWAYRTVSGYLPSEEAPLEATATSDDGSVVLYQARVDGGSDASLLLRDTRAGTTTLVDHAHGLATTADQEAETFALSGDGSTVAFTSRAGDLLGTDVPNGADVYVTDAHGGAVRAVAHPGVPDRDVREVSLSADGSRLAMVVGHAEGVSVLVVAVATGATLYRYDGDYATRSVRLSGDGRTVVYGATADGTSALQVVDVASGTVVASLPEWSGDGPQVDRTGTRVVYRAGEGPVPPGGWFGPARFLVWDRTHPADAGTEVLAPVGLRPTGPVVSADGSRLLLTAAPSDGGSIPSAAYAVDLPGGATQLVAGGDPDGGATGTGAYAGSLSADGSAVTLWLDGSIVSATRSSTSAGAPTWPGGASLSATPRSSTAVQLDWPAAAGDLKGYEVSVDGTVVATVAPDKRSTTVTAPDATAPHTYAVTAVSTSGARGTALSADARALAPLAVTRGAAGTLHLAFPLPAGTTGITGLRVLRAPGGQQADHPAVDPASYAKVADLPATATSYDDTGLAALTYYGYRVDALHADGSTSPLSESTVERTDLPDAVPVLVSGVGSTSATVTWPPAPAGTPLTAWRVERQDSGGAWATVASLSDASRTSYADTALTPGTAYAWRVSAVLGAGWPVRSWATATAATTRGRASRASRSTRRGSWAGAPCSSAGTSSSAPPTSPG
ncbi:fibronectin type III domain-containing protein [Motilibacter rhizosphaerae]|uniref:fibronectin type III domain-containing protein n=1 Tax=Motilibacter rhizosphaerae TaxID=598652 RepID=UPI00102C1B82|nr:fibronectin type III domain-containing protein [Motilibacter rhizosphaerae]